MKAQDFISALRIGSSIENPTPYKWFGLVCSVTGIVITAASSFATAKGWIHATVSIDDAILVAALVLGPLFTVSAHAAIATTDKIGVLPRASSGDTGMQREPVPADVDAAGGVTADDSQRSRSEFDDIFGKFGDS